MHTSRMPTFYTSVKSRNSFQSLDRRKTQQTSSDNSRYLEAELKLNKIMRENLNKKICEKRVKEELVETLREWGMAKASYHAE
mmetsp:Transcript_26495/g.30609  ORF Transcript_26495/g.30609 Transcript_26495/m.30609 type:complete len:83 (-) Transcript_26495:68-316(-)